MYEKEGILVPSEDEKGEFLTLQIPKVVIYDPILFPSIVHYSKHNVKTN